MAAGKPVVTTDVGLAGEVVEDGVTGIVIPRRNERELAEAIVRLIENGELRDKIGKQAQIKLFEKQNLHNCGKEMYKIYQKLLENVNNDTLAYQRRRR